MKNRTWVLAPAVVLLCIAANTALLVPKIPGWWAVQILCALATNLLPLSLPRQNGIRLWLLAYGNGCLKIFVVSTVFSVVMQILLGIYLSASLLNWLISLLVCVCILAITFWIGIICVYCTSVQLGI